MLIQLTESKRPYSVMVMQKTGLIIIFFLKKKTLLLVVVFRFVLRFHLSINFTLMTGNTKNIHTAQRKKVAERK